jgi:Ca2+-binding RTX toxin-like protein
MLVAPDTTAPTLEIGSSISPLGRNQRATITFTLSESGRDFSLTDVLVTGGLLRDFTGSGRVYSAISEATDSSRTSIEISVSTGAFSDLAGNANTQGAILSIAFTDHESYTGGNGVDSLAGGPGNDTLNGGAGADILQGGPGADVFVIGEGDRILDFKPEEGDKVDLSQVLAGLIGYTTPTNPFLGYYLDVTQSSDGKTATTWINIDRDGIGTQHGRTVLATLENTLLWQIPNEALLPIFEKPSSGSPDAEFFEMHLESGTDDTSPSVRFVVELASRFSNAQTIRAQYQSFMGGISGEIALQRTEDGRFAGEAPLPTYVATGWFLAGALFATDNEGFQLTIDRHDIALSGGPITGYLSNPGGDQTPPEITSIKVESVVINDDKIRATLSLKVEEQDTSLAPGATLGTQNSSGRGFGAPISFDASGNGTAVFEFSKYAKSEEYVVNGTSIKDLAGNFAPPTYLNNNKVSFVIDNPNQDIHVPELLDFKISARYSSATGRPIIVTSGLAADDISGVQTVTVVLKSPSGNYYGSGEALTTSTGGVRFGKDLPLITNFTPGAYLVEQVVMTDQADNEIVLRSTDLAQRGFPDRINVHFVTDLSTPQVTGSSDDDFIFGTDETNDSLTGNSGNDSIYAGSGADRLFGGEGHDELNGGNGADSLTGGAGNDTYIVDNLGDLVSEVAGQGIDSVLTSIDYALGGEVEALLIAPSAANGTKGTGNSLDNILEANDAGNELQGGGGNDKIKGGKGRDKLVGGDGDDSVDAGEGDDEIVGGDGAGNDTYSGGAGNDTVRYTSALASIDIDLTLGFARTMTGLSVDAAGIGQDSLQDIEYAIAGEFSDRVSGSAIANRLDGRAGNDTLIGLDGNDTLEGGAGNDSLDGGLGIDVAVFSGQRSDYRIQFDGDLLTVTDLRLTGQATATTSSVNGSDTLTAIEVLRFTDQDLTVDRSRPSIVIGSSKMILKTGETSTLSFTLSKPSTDFVAADIASSGGTITNFSGSGTAYTATFTADFKGTSTAVISVASGVFADALGNLNQDGSDSDNALSITRAPEASAVLGQVYHWKSHALLQTVSVEATPVDNAITGSVSATKISGLSSASGVFNLADIKQGTYALQASLPLTSQENGAAISAADALAALKLSVGINPNTDPDGPGPLTAPPVSPYQYLAADVNGDKRVSAADALAILKMAVKRTDAPARSWLFVDERHDFWDEQASSGKGAFTLNRQSVPKEGLLPLNKALSPGEPVNLVALLKGDVNGSWSSTGAPPLSDTYFYELVSSHSSILHLNQFNLSPL